MPIRPDAPLKKVTLNLFEADVLAMSTYYGHGWTEQVRALVHAHITTATSHARVRRTLGDLHDEQSS